jgi:hypothetical protein
LKLTTPSAWLNVITAGLVTFCSTVVKLYYAGPEKDHKDELTQTQPQVIVLSLSAAILLKQGHGRSRKYPLLTVTADIEVCI